MNAINTATSSEPFEAPRSIAAIASLGVEAAAPGFVQGTIGLGGPVPLDPFLSITEFWMSEPIFAPHPHAGFSAVTYMFTDSEGQFVNRDSLGDRSLIGPGALHWTQAGAGMMHEEVPEVLGVQCHGMQLFVNLRAEHKHLAPRAFHLDADQVPSVTPVDGALVRVVLGSWNGVPSPLDGLAELVGLFDVELAPAVELDRDFAHDERVVVLVHRGQVTIGDQTIEAHHVAVLDGPEVRTVLRAGDEGASLLLLTGRPMNEPVVFGGSFVALDRVGIDELNRRFRQGDMGTLAPSFTPGSVPPRSR